MLEDPLGKSDSSFRLFISCIYRNYFYFAKREGVIYIVFRYVEIFFEKYSRLRHGECINRRGGRFAKGIVHFVALAHNEEAIKAVDFFFCNSNAANIAGSQGVRSSELRFKTNFKYKVSTQFFQG